MVTPADLIVRGNAHFRRVEDVNRRGWLQPATSGNERAEPAGRGDRVLAAMVTLFRRSFAARTTSSARGAA